MKKILFPLLCACIVLFTSCKKEAETPPAKQPETPSLDASRLLHLSFNNNLTDASATNAVSASAQGSFVADALANANSAYYLTGGNKLTYSLANYANLKVGTTGDFSLSIKVKFDTTYLYNEYLATANKIKYASFFEIGDGLVLRYLCANDPREKRIQCAVRKTGNLYLVGGNITQTTISTTNNGWVHAGWNTITVTYKRNPANMKMYFNGALVNDLNDVSFDNASIDYSGTNQTLSLGSGSVANQSWQGNIDNVYLFNRVLTQAEVTQIAGQ